MGFDFSALDAELEALGKEPADLLQLAARYAGDPGELRDLAAVDSVLSGLGEAAPVAVAPLQLTRTKAASVRPPPPPPLEQVRSQAKPAPAPVSVVDEDPLELAEELTTAVEPLTQFKSSEPAPFSSEAQSAASSPRSGELALPGAVKRPNKDPISGELQLDQGEPSSGSFALPDPIEETSAPVFVTNRPPRPDAARAASDYPEMQVDSLEEDDPDTQAVFAALDDLPDSATPSGGAALKGLSDLPAEPSGARPDGRNVDAEFDAIFSDATSPSGIPTRGYGFGDDDSPSAEELLTGLEASPPSAQAKPPSEQYSDSEDHTEILDKGTLNSITAAAKSEDNPFPEELGSSEFEIVLDGDAEPAGIESDSASSAPQGKRSPPPPLPPSGSTNLDKRPSFLGRIFGRKDGPPN